MSKSLLNSKTAPHLLLGIQPDARSSDAMIGFARASKRVKTSESAPFTIEDLTSALSEFETLERAQEFGLRYAVPANPAVFEVEASFIYKKAVLGQSDDLTVVLIKDISEKQKEKAGRTFLSSSISALLQWNWDLAAHYARSCLRLSSNEDERDEALNVLAASLAMLGEGLKAIDALKKAVEGRWNLALQTNLAMIASEVDPGLAVTHMSYLIDGAETEDEKLKTCLLAISLWQNSQSEVTGSDDEDDFEPLPRSLLDSIAQFIESQEIGEENFYTLGKFLARVDSENLSSSDVMRRCKYANTVSAKLICARVNGYFEFFSEVAKIAGLHEHTRPWINKEVDDCVSQVNKVIVDSSKEESNFKLFFNIGFKYLEDGLDCSSRERILLRAIQAYFVLQFLENEDTAPSSKFIIWLAEAKQQSGKNYLKMSEDEKQGCLNIIGEAADRLAIRYHDTQIGIAAKMAEASNSLEARTTGFFNNLTTNRTDNRKVAVAVSEFCHSALEDLNTCLPLVANKDVKSAVKKLVLSLHTSLNKVQQHL